MGRNIINISVPPRLNDFVKSRIKSGRYASVSEYFRELIKLDEERELARLDEIKRRESGQYPGRPGRNFR
jgi:putative addiction module CopG family antidote